MLITIASNENSEQIEVDPNESALYKEVGKRLLDLRISNHLTVSTPLGNAKFDVTQRGTFVKSGCRVPSMYVKEIENNINLPHSTYQEAYLTCINPGSNNYKFYHFKPKGEFLHATYGRIGSKHGEMFGAKDLQTPYPIHLYWIRYYEKLSKGYVDASDIYLAPQNSRELLGH